LDKIRDLVPDIEPGKLFIKPFHQVAFHREILSWQEKKRTILFMGPESSHKKLQPVIDLIKCDKERRFRYLFCAMHENLDAKTRVFLDAQDNVELSYGYVEDEKYYSLFSEVSFIILTHNLDFEGALSGIFCDAIASGTPIIARDMAPHNEFFNRFGPMGILVNYEAPEWCKHVLNHNSLNKYEEFQHNMAKCRDSCNMEAIRGVFRVVLDLP